MRLIRRGEVERKRLGDRGVSHRLIAPESGYRELELYVNVLEPGSGPGPYHYHSNADNVYFVVEGQGDVTVAGTRHRVREGDTIVLSRGERHDIENMGRDELRVLEIKVPAGSDFVMAEDERAAENTPPAEGPSRARRSEVSADGGGGVRDVVNSARYDVPGFTGKFTQAVRVKGGSGLLFVSGLTARDEKGDIRGEGDIVEQTEWVLRGLSEVCKAAGATMADVVKVTVFVRHADDMRKIREVKHRWFGEPAPASTTVEVSRLFDPAQLIEIEAVVALP